MDVNFELYKMFYHTVKAGSFSAAAKTLFISQSAVSQGIKNLETKLGTRLFLRKRAPQRSLRLTTEGELLFSHVKQAYHLLKAAEEKLGKINNLTAGEVRIGASDTVCKYFLLPQVQNFNAKYPGVKIQFYNRTSPQIREALRNGLLDFGIITVKEREDGFKVTDLYEVEDIFVAGRKFSHLQGRLLPLQKLSELPLLMLDKKSSTRELIDDFLTAQGLKVTPEMELESIDLLVELAKIGFGVAHVLKESAAGAIADGVLFPVRFRTGLPKRKLGIITPKDVPLSRAASTFIELLVHQTEGQGLV
ncbi:MAG TPA: LysR family transcriptional regulator [Firmicutes bacterium]|nr:LysR family transcriptional regulator [Bacillota bacterium]